MALVRFWQKPGCRGNARQIAALTAAGHHVEVHDLLSHPWTGGELRAFFGARPVAEWFNRSAPAVKAGEVVPSVLDEAAALALLIQDPLLIRRPLLESGGRREAGFDPARLDAWLGLRTPDGAVIPAAEGCASTDEPCVR